MTVQVTPRRKNLREFTPEELEQFACMLLEMAVNLASLRDALVHVAGAASTLAEEIDLRIEAMITMPPTVSH
jgi:hypothetical protein